jgi:hypothetical protein
MIALSRRIAVKSGRTSKWPQRPFSNASAVVVDVVQGVDVIIVMVALITIAVVTVVFLVLVVTVMLLAVIPKNGLDNSGHGDTNDGW